MHCIKFWLDLLASLTTVLALPIAIYFFLSEQNHNFVTGWAEKFNGKVDPAEPKAMQYLLASAYLASLRPWRSIYRSVALIRQAFIDGAELQGHPSDQIHEFYEKNWNHVWTIIQRSEAEERKRKRRA